MILRIFDEKLKKICMKFFELLPAIQCALQLFLSCPNETTKINFQFLNNLFYHLVLYFQAVCCNDHTHCCPKGYTCDVAQGTCMKGDLQTQWFMKTPARQVYSVECPDHQSECPEGNTCCMLKSGQYGCCPLPKVC